MANEDDQKFPSQTADKYVVRFPDGMRDRIAEAAKTNNRSMNAELVARIEQSFEPPATSEETRAQLRYKDMLIGQLILATVSLRHSLFHTALLVERIPRTRDIDLLPERCMNIAESARERAKDHDFALREGALGMTPELDRARREAVEYMEHHLALTRARFAADPEKLLELLEQELDPTLEQLRAIAKTGDAARAPAVESAEQASNLMEQRRRQQASRKTD